MASDEHVAAQAIQASYRGQAARTRLREYEGVALPGSQSASGLEASEQLTPEVAAALACELRMSATGQLTYTRLAGAGRRLTASSLAQAFVALPSLTSVDLSYNRLTTLDGLECCPLLSSLVCRGNRLMGVLDFAAAAGPLAHHTHASGPRVRCAHHRARVHAHPVPFCILCGLDRPAAHLRAVDAGGSRLRYADLSDNSISGAVSLPIAADGRARGVDAHAYLESMLLDGNQLRSLRGVGAAVYLVHFSAAGNKLGATDTAGIGPLQRLRTLDLSANELRRCTEIGGLAALRTIRLGYNQLSSLPDLRGLHSLSTLEIAHNRFESLDAITSAVGGMPTLTNLTLVEGNAPIAALPDPRLEVLYALPSVSRLDGTPSTPEETVAACNSHGDDTQALAAIRKQYFPDVLNSREATQLPGILAAYRNQYKAAWAAGRQPDEAQGRGGREPKVG